MQKMADEDTTQNLQNKVDKLKLLNLTNNIHSLTPPQNRGDDKQDSIALVAALSAGKRIACAVLNLRGLVINEETKELERIREPIMNIDGVMTFIDVCRTIAEETEWATYSEDELPTRIIHYYEETLPYFTFWFEEYELDKRHFIIIQTYLKTFIDSSFHKAKQGKYINTLGRTYSEDLLNKALSNEKEKEKKRSLLGDLNPFQQK